MKITVDTNVLVRAAVQDDKAQARTAAKLLTNADVIAVTVPALCEFVWVLRKVYSLARADIATAVRALLNTAKVVAPRTTVEAGLAMLEAGGDFADGAIAYEGRHRGGETFVSFDKDAVTRLTKQGYAAKQLP